MDSRELLKIVIKKGTSELAFSLGAPGSREEASTEARPESGTGLEHRTSRGQHLSGRAGLQAGADSGLTARVLKAPAKMRKRPRVI